ncbi:MAG: DUF1801 domain-containing protein [Bacteroidota bacterium]
MNAKVDFYFNKAKTWQEELKLMRTLVLDCHLAEELKWGCPCYMCPPGLTGRVSDKSNIVLIHTFKDYCAFLFFKGALLKDPKKILIQQTENVQAARQVRFTSVKEITRLEKTLKAYIFEAIEIEEKGLKVPMKKTREYTIPEEFQIKLDKNAALKKAFEALTPGRQRGYLLYFSSAKQATTREERIKKYMKQILTGKGLDD